MFHLLEDIKMLQEFCALLSFNFIMTYIIHEILMWLKSNLNYLKYRIFECFFSGYNILDSYFFK